jgi:hypothetical protein
MSESQDGALFLLAHTNGLTTKTANTTIAMTSTELANPSYVLSDMCSWTGSAWKCGCRDNACTQR